ncbi:MAG: potassium channel protein [Gemmatimonadetes bacterium]|jgi:Trk K+ transport system NAD-binding subunit|nr:potassium channel protein [Gemmatimonadota bacterium]
MKFISAQLAYFFANRTAKRNLRSLLRFVALLLVMMTVFTILFHYIAAREGQDHSWLSGLYWTVVTMTTLGYGDITFQSDLGRVFAVVVLLSGVLFLLVLLPFAFIQFFYAPWIEAQSQMRAPRELPQEMAGHVIFTEYDALTISLIDRLRYHGRRYAVLQKDVQRALELYDQGISVMVGELDDQETYRRARAPSAALVVVGGNDFLNTNITYTVRELTERVPIVSLARSEDSLDILELAGSTRVLQLAEMLGRSLSRRTMGGETRANVIGRFGELLIAEAPVTGTPLVGKRLIDSRLREVTGLTVVGVWNRGNFEIPRPEMTIESTTALVLAGSEEQLRSFDELTAIYNLSEEPVIILGGGRVGRAAAHALAEREIPYCIVEQNPDRVHEEDHYIVGSAADLEVLERAGIRTAPTVMVTTNDDPTNIYLTIYCRRLRPDIQIVSRATLERNVSTLHRAGADFVMSYASMGANAIFNVLEQDDVVMLAEGLDVFRYPTPASLVGKPLATSGIREATGCSVVALERNGKPVINPDPGMPLPQQTELILIGTTEGERQFVERYGR